VGTKRYAAPALIALMLAGGCASTAKAAHGAGAPTPAAASPSPVWAAPAYDANKVCDLLTPDEIKVVTGTAVAAGTVGDSQAGSWVECRYVYAAESLSIVRVRLATSTNSAAYFDAARADVTTTSLTVPGADEARWDAALGTVYATRDGVSLFVQIEDDYAINQSRTEALAVRALTNLGRLG
jgi:hypothetical protein